MTTANDVIAALNQRRLLKAGRAPGPTGLPPGWQRWFDAQPRTDAATAEARPRGLIDVFAARPLRPPPPRSAPMGRLAALRSLMRQGPEPDDPAERGLRIGAGALDILMHIVLVGFLLWLMYLGMLALQRAPQEDEAVQVEFIGRGNIEEGGGALAAEGAPSAPAAAAPSSTAEAAQASDAATPPPTRFDARAAAESVAAAEPTPPAAAETAPVPEAQAAQPIQVSEVQQPDPEAVQLPPPRPVDIAAREVQLRTRQPTVREVEVVARPVVRVDTTVPQPQPREVQLRMPEVQAREQAVEVVRPDQIQRSVAIPAPSRTDATLAMPTVRGQVRDIPVRPGAPAQSAQAGDGRASSAQATAAGAGGERGTAPSAGQAAAGNREGNRAAQDSGRGVTTAGSGAGPGTRPAPGGWPGAAKSDDWGASSRNVAGNGSGSGRDGSGTPGLYNSDGSLRLPDEWTKQSGIDIDRAGTWLKRPGLEYRGTRFDRYWVPQGTLLEEWVRRGIKRIAIPIPGSSTRLECVVSLLQLGGGCFPVNPDVNEQPATARPPPKIPFKPELQEDNGSQRPQDGG
ncbi:transmembrane repetitive protein [Thermomonas brevis]